MKRLAEHSSTCLCHHLACLFLHHLFLSFLSSFLAFLAFSFSLEHTVLILVVQFFCAPIGIFPILFFGPIAIIFIPFFFIFLPIFIITFFSHHVRERPFLRPFPFPFRLDLKNFRPDLPFPLPFLILFLPPLPRLVDLPWNLL